MQPKMPNRLCEYEVYSDRTMKLLNDEDGEKMRVSGRKPVPDQVKFTD